MLTIGSTVINCADIDRMTAFWSAALGYVPATDGPDDDFRKLEGPAVNLSLQRAATPVSARDQMHLDLYADDKAGEVARLIGLGASYVRSSPRDDEDDFDVLLDPEGNEFCVCAKGGLA